MSDPTVNSLLAVSDGLFLVFDESGELCDWNQTVVERTAADPESLSTMTPGDIVADEDADTMQDAIEALDETERTTVETVLVTDAGARRHYEFTLQQLTEADGEPTYGAIGRDITERKRAQQEREAIFDRMSDGVFAVDTGWHITYANAFGATVLSEAMGRELTPDEIEGCHLWEEIPEAVDTVFYDNYHEAMATQEPVTFEEYYEPLDIWFDVRAYPSETGLSVYLYDITERYRNQAAVERRERILREMHEIIADHDRGFQDQVESILELGRNVLETTYGTLSRIDGEEYHFEIVASDDDSIQSGDVGALSATNCERVASTEETVVLGDVARDAPDQTDRAGFTDWGISCYIGAPVYVADGVYGTFCFYDTDPRDGEFSTWEQTIVDLMSRWVSYELQRQRATEQLEAKTERLEAKNEQLEQFAEMVSHDLRNPLEVLTGWLENAKETGSEDAFDRCFNALDRMNTLIDDILTLAQAGSVIDERTPLDIAVVAQAAWETVETPDSTLVVETDRTIRADETRLQQLFANLFRNAIEHGGRDVTIRIGSLDDHGFYVEDDGPGIPAADREAVLESGYTTSDDGTGFGLAIVAEVADAHGWEVTVTEGADGGARFECTGV
ncbi:two-component system sensor histidine kinase/response regulator [Halonotius aquaticus]|uniref:histidine kinase n=1 Tax=Halonotius aquaticus TaxID=2216978 RepID=A0A3A6PJW0_9EURY|nr:PAS domain-containing protein [Halonotius aquaticus]RJX42294.1 two-component system sensor histidine kinase/response regulator [Halonotius aquaticus]